MEACHHQSQFAKFSLYKSAPCLYPVRRGVSRNIIRAAGVAVFSMLNKVFSAAAEKGGFDTFDRHLCGLLLKMRLECIHNYLLNVILVFMLMFFILANPYTLHRGHSLSITFFFSPSNFNVKLTVLHKK